MNAVVDKKCGTEKDVVQSPLLQEVSFAPQFDIFESDDVYVLYGDMPGVSVEDLDLRYESGSLTIHGKAKPRPEHVDHLRREYAVGDYHRTFHVGEAIDIAAISAELKDGVLTLQLPKSERVKPRRIEVKSS